MKRWICLAALIMSVVSVQADPVGWRGDGSGIFPNTTPATEWSPTKNVVWKTKMPDWSNATPVIVGDKIFVMSEPDLLICCDVATGKILWQKSNSIFDAFGAEGVAAQAEMKSLQIKEKKKTLDELRGKIRSVSRPISRRLEKQKKAYEKKLKDADAEKTEKLKASIAKIDADIAARKKELALLRPQEKELQSVIAPFEKYLPHRKHKTTGYTSPSPVSDGKNVYIVMGNGVAACYDLAGDRKWITHVGSSLQGWGFSTSPLLVDGKLLVNLAAVAIDVKTGKIAWSYPAYRGIPWGTGCVITVGGENLWLTPDGMIYRISDGKKLAEKQAYTEYNGLIQADGVVYFVQNKGTAVTLPAKAEEGMKLTPKYTFKMDKNRYYASPVLYDGRIYAITRYCQFTVTEAATGKVLSTRKLDELNVKGVDIYPSICIAGDRLFISNDEGTTVIMTPGDEPVLEKTNTLEPFRSTPIFQGGRMYIRGLGHLWCIGK